MFSFSGWLCYSWNSEKLHSTHLSVMTLGLVSKTFTPVWFWFYIHLDTKTLDCKNQALTIQICPTTHKPWLHGGVMRQMVLIVSTNEPVW